MSLFEELVKNANTTLDCWEKIITFLQSAEGPGGEKFNQEVEVPGTGQELRWFNERALAVCNLIKSLKKIEMDTAASVPLTYMNQLEQASQQLKDTILETANSVEQVQDNGVASLDPSNWEVVAKETNVNFNFASRLQIFQSHTEALLTSFYQVSSIVGSRKFDTFEEAVREISKKAESARKSVDEISKAKKSAKGDASVTSKQKDQSTEVLSEVSIVLGKAQEALSKIEEINQSSQSKFEEVSEISNNAGSLKPKVDEYETEFQAFQQSLDSRNAAFEKLRGNVEALYSVLKEKDEQIGDAIQHAEEMLQMATNAGLAGTFKASLSELDRKLKRAQGVFYFSIFILFLSALPLASYLFLPLVTGFFDPQTVEASDATKGIWGFLTSSFNENNLSLSATIALSLLAAPAIWLTKFSAARHHQLFQLKEDYHYKYSLAMAVDGFKRQAPDYAEAIAAETFSRLLFNPADRLEGKGSSDGHPSPITNILMDKFGLNEKGKGQ